MKRYIEIDGVRVEFDPSEAGFMRCPVANGDLEFTDIICNHPSNKKELFCYYYGKHNPDDCTDSEVLRKCPARTAPPTTEESEG